MRDKNKAKDTMHLDCPTDCIPLITCVHFKAHVKQKKKTKEKEEKKINLFNDLISLWATFSLLQRLNGTHNKNDIGISKKRVRNNSNNEKISAAYYET